jgi:hypothetical protein
MNKIKGEGKMKKFLVAVALIVGLFGIGYASDSVYSENLVDETGLAIDKTYVLDCVLQIRTVLRFLMME